MSQLPTLDSTLTLEEITATFGLSNWTLRRLIREEKLTAWKVGREWRVGKNSLATYLSETRNN